MYLAASDFIGIRSNFTWGIFNYFQKKYQVITMKEIVYPRG